MKTVKMLFENSPREYSYDTQEDLKVGERFSTPSYPAKVIVVNSIEPKDETIKVPYTIKEIIIGEQPKDPDKNKVYVTKLI